MNDVKIRFIETREVKDHNGDVIDRFLRGRVYALNPHSADRWMRRSAAELASAKTERAAAKQPDPEPDPEPDPGTESADNGQP